ncbi:Collagenase [Pseudolycoriella hygida]|uniref:Collagenase n=1 Tax=Pseudolycoriella hygida TaxID=35572 RepID=A0A9Q0N0Y0_9DIPT|nr:Collagenase [Pseudolycoriella hygida]
MASSAFLTIQILVILVILFQGDALPGSRIINGSPATKYQFPWHVLLSATRPDNTRRNCGGSLIAPNFVLTVASCIETATTIKVDAGIISYYNATETQNATLYRLHDEYDSAKGLNDIAIIRLDKNFTYHDNVRPITLPGKSQVNNTFVYQQTYFSGFGMTNQSSNQMSNTLQYSSNIIISNDFCKKSLDRDNVPLCAVSYESSVCLGDQGGALVANISSSWYQIGLLSHINPNGCYSGSPHTANDLEIIQFTINFHCEKKIENIFFIKTKMASSAFLTIQILVILVILFQGDALPQSRIINGSPAIKNQFPWHVLLSATRPDNTRRNCGGSLIAPNFVLTVASCIETATTIKVDAGIISYYNATETQNATLYRLHDAYDSSKGLNDIAVIKLDKNFTYHDNVRPITLPGKSQVNNTFVYQQTYFSGFGMTNQSSNQMSNTLQYSSNIVISNDFCKKSLDRDNVPLCAVSYESSVCLGDQGGALVANISSSWYQIGLLSHINPNGCSNGSPHVYTKVTDYLGWIAFLTGLNFDY